METRTIPKKMLIAIIVAIFMTGFFWIQANADPASAISVTVQAEDPNGGFIIEPKIINVTAGYANSFTGGTYSNTSPATNSDVTVLDVLFAAHADKYGTAFTSSTYTNYIGGSAGYITEMFDIEAGDGYGFPAIMFVVNGVQPHDNDPTHTFPAWGSQGPATGYMTYAINQSIVTSGKTVNLFFINSYNDIYPYITVGNTSYLGFNPLFNTFTSTQTINLKGYDVFSDGYLEQSAWTIVNLANAKICRVSDGYQVGSADSNGSVNLSNLTLSNGDNHLTVKPNTTGTNYIPMFFTVHKS